MQVRVSVRKCASWACRLALLPLLAVAVATGAPRALLIGLSYEGSEVSSLPGIDVDLKLARQVARDMGIRDIRELWNAKATLQGIVSAIEELGTGVGAEDLVLIYFSGHGTRVPDRGELDEQAEDGMDEVLVAFDAMVTGEDSRNMASLRNVLVDDEFGRLLAAIPSRKVLVVVDACNSGTATKGIGATPKFYRYPGFEQARAGKGFPVVEAGSGGANFIGIMAAQDDELANATKDGSVLTKALHKAVRTLKGRDASGVSVEDLFQEMEKLVVDDMRVIAQHNSSASQHPVLFVPAAAPDLRQLRLPLVAELAGGLEPPTDDPLINEWQGIARSAARQIEFKVNEQTFVPHPDPGSRATRCNAERYAQSLLAVEVVAPGDGYLNVVDLQQGKSAKLVLFPNEFQPDNKVRRGQTIRIPSGSYCLPAQLDPGVRQEWNLVVALFSEAERNLYRESKSKGSFATTDQDLKGDRRGFVLSADGFRYDAAGTQTLLISEQ